jgi:hypothetical protein
MQGLGRFITRRGDHAGVRFPPLEHRPPQSAHSGADQDCAGDRAQVSLSRRAISSVSIAGLRRAFHESGRIMSELVRRTGHGGLIVPGPRRGSEPALNAGAQPQQPVRLSECSLIRACTVSSRLETSQIPN